MRSLENFYEQNEWCAIRFLSFYKSQLFFHRLFNFHFSLQFNVKHSLSGRSSIFFNNRRFIEIPRVRIVLNVNQIKKAFGMREKKIITNIVQNYFKLLECNGTEHAITVDQIHVSNYLHCSAFDFQAPVSRTFSFKIAAYQ